MNGLLDKVINIFIRVGSVFTGVLLAAWIYHSLLEFISDKFWNRSNIPWGVSTLIFYLTLICMDITINKLLYGSDDSFPHFLLSINKILCP